MLVIGDDLTGSNATGALYARLGLQAVTVGELAQVPRYAHRVDVLVVNTASRHWAPSRAYAAVRAATEAAGEVPLVVKRVDTTLRGNPGRELDAVVDALTAHDPSARIRALAVPAFPDAGRTTVGGLHLVDGVPLTRTAVARDPFDPVRHARVAEVLRTQSERNTAELTLDVVERGPDAVAAALRECRADIVVCDATENAHLRTVAVAAAQLADEDGIRWVVMDSGPFGAALAAELGLRSQDGPPARILAVIGSITDRTRVQLAHAEAAFGVRWADLDPSDPDPDRVLGALRAAARQGATVLGVRVAPEPRPGATGASAVPDSRSAAAAVPDPDTAARILRCLAEVARRAVAGLRPGALYASGGDVAAAVTSALGADGFAIETEVLPLAVAGHLVGGPYDGLLFATKGGLIGGPDATRDCLEHLRAACTRHTLGAHPTGAKQPPAAPEPEADAPDADAPDTEAPDPDAGDTAAPDTDAADVDAPDPDASELAPISLTPPTGPHPER
ncbi:four-carbon acid sugar kinase family protein [Streptomyces halobius]|uniref:Four-carbon acid sugar kinase family protein n=1 Tax=Streptomyces halobius TaxID=2879846 RepID=A0ABY4MLS0_9ACTN|nr:four-carbon acid sugar kinase family protein [Streptomyces halobius]UQA98132.1 four-carbon acid sugar kinase family protein [Streptomyces halobius]